MTFRISANHRRVQICMCLSRIISTFLQYVWLSCHYIWEKETIFTANICPLKCVLLGSSLAHLEMMSFLATSSSDGVCCRCDGTDWNPTKRMKQPPAAQTTFTTAAPFVFRRLQSNIKTVLRTICKRKYSKLLQVFERPLNMMHDLTEWKVLCDNLILGAIGTWLLWKGSENATLSEYSLSREHQSHLLLCIVTPATFVRLNAKRAVYCLWMLNFKYNFPSLKLPLTK